MEYIPALGMGFVDFPLDYCIKCEKCTNDSKEEYEIPCDEIVKHFLRINLEERN